MLCCKSYKIFPRSYVNLSLIIKKQNFEPFFGPSPPNYQIMESLFARIYMTCAHRSLNISCLALIDKLIPIYIGSRLTYFINPNQVGVVPKYFF
jgi:hypothetical protein